MMIKRAKKKPPGAWAGSGRFTPIPGVDHTFSSAQIREVKVGHRRELTLAVETWPKGSNRFGGGEVFTLRLGALFNFEEVRDFFVKPPVDEHHHIGYLQGSNPRRHVIEMEFDRSEYRLKIIAGKISVKSSNLDTRRGQ